MITLSRFQVVGLGLLFAPYTAIASNTHARAQEGLQALADVKAYANEGRPLGGASSNPITADPVGDRQRLTQQILAVSAGSTIAGGITHVVTDTIEYRAQVAEAGREALVLKREVVRIHGAIVRALAPELETVGALLVEEESKRIAAGVGRGSMALTKERASQTIAKVLSDKNVQSRILERLRTSLGPAAENAFQKILSPRAIGELGVGFEQAVKLASTGLGAKARSSAGVLLADTVARSISNSVARLTLPAALAATGGAAKSLLARCMGPVAEVLKIAASDAVAGVTIMLHSSVAEGATLSNSYAQHPERLLELSNEEAAQWIEGYPWIADSLIRLRDVLRAADEAETQSSGAYSADIGGVMNCQAPPVPLCSQ